MRRSFRARFVADHVILVALLADDQIHVHRLVDPVFEVALVLDIKDFVPIALRGPQVRIPLLSCT